MLETNTLICMTPRVRQLWQREMDNMYKKRPWWGEGLSIYDGSNKDQALKKEPIIIRKSMAFDLLLDERVDLVARDVIRPPGTSQEEITRTNLQAMDESIDTALFVALVSESGLIRCIGVDARVVDEMHIVWGELVADGILSQAQVDAVPLCLPKR